MRRCPTCNGEEIVKRADTVDTRDDLMPCPTCARNDGRLPWWPVEREVLAGRPHLADEPVKAIADMVGVDRRQVQRWRADGLSLVHGDRLAIMLLNCPARCVWPDVFAALDEIDLGAVDVDDEQLRLV